MSENIEKYMIVYVKGNAQHFFFTDSFNGKETLELLYKKEGINVTVVPLDFNNPYEIADHIHNLERR